MSLVGVGGFGVLNSRLYGRVTGWGCNCLNQDLPDSRILKMDAFNPANPSILNQTVASPIYCLLCVGVIKSGRNIGDAISSAAAVFDMGYGGRDARAPI